jgi:glycerol-3-phosphate acyltransferase PlsY
MYNIFPDTKGALKNSDVFDRDHPLFPIRPQENIMNFLLVAILGYLIGSISFARIVMGVFSSDKSIQDIQLQVPGTQAAFRSNAVSASFVNTQLGPRFGCLTSLLDMGKIGIPTLLLKFYFPESTLYLIFAAFCTLGHIWPLYYGFQGGRGMSTILIALAIVDWQGVLVSFSISLAVGIFRKDFYIGNKLSILLLIPWLWFRTHNWTLVLFAVALNLMNIIAVIPEIKEINRLRKEGNLQQFLQAETIQVSDEYGEDLTYRNTFYGEYQQLIRGIRRWMKKRFSDEKP